MVMYFVKLLLLPHPWDLAEQLKFNFRQLQYLVNYTCFLV
jgi:hypothetical protein